MSPELKHILTILPRLEKDELKAVAERLNAMRVIVGSEPAEVGSGSEDWLFRGYVDVLKKKGLYRLGRLDRRSFQQRGGLKTQEWIKKNTLVPLNDAELFALGRLVAMAHIAFLEKRGMSVSPRLLWQTVKWVPEAVDNSWPGYVRNGMLPALVVGIGGKRGRVG